ncbi:MAG: hypothetical protein IJ386_08930 [Clostridia bacterium]|nr:hypothetical protein [Clostridia bacterium]
MKKIITLIIIAAMLASASACEKDEPDFKETVTVINTTAAVTEDSANAPTVITVEDIKAVIDAAKKEYAESAEVKLSDGTVMSAELKDPGITVESITDGTATEEQMGNYAMYLVNIRKLACDRLITAFPAGNTVVFSNAESTSDLGDFIFLDPKSEGYDNAMSILMDLSDKDKADSVTADYVYIQNNVVALFDGKTEETTLLCPTDDENAILAAIAAKLNPDMLTEKAEQTRAE